MLGVGLAVPASGQPPAEPSPTATITLGSRQLGTSPSIRFNDRNVAQRLSIPVPDGLSPIELTGELQSASNVRSGFVDAIASDGRLLGTVPVPDSEAGPTTA